MNAVCTVRFAVAALILSAVGALSAATPARADDGDTYAAIVYSPNGKYGYATRETSKDQAENDAREQCKATGDLVAVWAKNGYVALAVGDGEDGPVAAAAGATRKDAESNAKKKCKEAGGVNPQIVICISSDGE